jgi:C_GCAxxG_C_C family probable redox protein
MNCAQSVLTVFCEDLGLDRISALKIATGFGGGMARSGRTCGAATGAYMVLGLTQRLTPENPRESLEKTYALIREFNKQFEAAHGSLTCRDLLSIDLNTPEGLISAREKKVFTTVCPVFVSDAVKILDSLLH